MGFSRSRSSRKWYCDLTFSTVGISHSYGPTCSSFWSYNETAGTTLGIHEDTNSLPPELPCWPHEDFVKAKIVTGYTLQGVWFPWANPKIFNHATPSRIQKRSQTLEILLIFVLNPIAITCCYVHEAITLFQKQVHLTNVVVWMWLWCTCHGLMCLDPRFPDDHAAWEGHGALLHTLSFLSVHAMWLVTSGSHTHSFSALRGDIPLRCKLQQSPTSSSCFLS